MRLNLLDRYVENFGCLDNDNPIPNPDKKRKYQLHPIQKQLMVSVLIKSSIVLLRLYQYYGYIISTMPQKT